LDRLRSAVKSFTDNTSGQAADRADTIFPPTRLSNALKVRGADRVFIAPRVSEATGAALAGVLELVCAEILEMSAKIAKEQKRQRITSTFVRMAIQSEPALMELFGNTIIGADMNTHREMAQKEE